MEMRKVSHRHPLTFGAPRGAPVPHGQRGLPMCDAHLSVGLLDYSRTSDAHGCAPL